MIQQENSSPIKTRFAPTPSGYLHIGNALNFLLTWVEAKKQGASIILRIDDLDGVRSRDEYIQDIIESLHWLDLEYHEGPDSVESFHQNYSQKKRMDIYRDSLKDFNPEMLYWCDCSRSDIKQRYENGIYQGYCSNRNLKQVINTTALRIKVDPDFHKDEYNLFNEMGDFIIWRKDDIPAYQLASILDDKFYGVNLIIRGEDLKTSTLAQLYISNQLEQLSFDKNMILYHELFKEDGTGKKLSKSEGSDSLKSLREKHKESSFVYSEIARRLCLEDYRDYRKKEDFLRILDGQNEHLLFL